MAWKGVQARVELTGVQIVISVVSVASGATILCCLFILPYLWRRIMQEDWQLKWHQVWRGPWLLKLPPPPSPPPGMRRLNIKDYYGGHMNEEEVNVLHASEIMMRSVQSSATAADLDKDEEFAPLPPPAIDFVKDTADEPVKIGPPRPPGPWHTWRVIWWKCGRIVFHGIEKDVISMQKRSNIFSFDIAEMHARAPRYDNRAEYMYSALQIMTASAASFIHGANDVANAMGPFTSAYYIWQTGKVESTAPVPYWVL